MRSAALFAVTGLTLIPSWGLCQAQDPPPPSVASDPNASAPPRFAVGTSSVLLDVVVRDRRGRLVQDLKAEDFEVREDGARQSLASFRAVRRPENAAAVSAPTGAATPSPGTAPPVASPPRPIEAPLVAFVFDRMGARGRDMARRAAASYLATARPGADLVGVFSVDLSLHTLQPFTNDPGLVAAAFERAASTGHTAFAASTARADVRQRIEEMADADVALATATGMMAGGGGGLQSQKDAGKAALVKSLGEIEVRLQRSFERLERSQQGYATTSALLSVVESLGRVPGRKTVVLLSEGLVLPESVEPRFRDLVARANEVNVSFYTMDAGGLRVVSPAEETAQELRQAGQRRLKDVEGMGSAGEVSLMRPLERTEDLLRFDPRSGLGQLAEETGGFLIRDTNDAAASLRRIEEDMRFHYVIAYSPTNEKFDGRFRRVAVRVKRRGVAVFARAGYVASPRVASAASD